MSVPVASKYSSGKRRGAAEGRGWERKRRLQELPAEIFPTAIKVRRSPWLAGDSPRPRRGQAALGMRPLRCKTGWVPSPGPVAYSSRGLREPSTGGLFSAFSGHQNIPVLANVNDRWRRSNYPLSAIIIVVSHKGNFFKRKNKNWSAYRSRSLKAASRALGNTRVAVSSRAMKFFSRMTAI